MNKFLLKTTLALALLIFAFLGMNLVFMLLDIKIYENKVGREVEYVIEKAEKRSKFGKVCLGDSVCRQIFYPRSEEKWLCHLGSTDAVTPCGQYLLLHQYLDNNPQTKEVYLFWRPNGFSNEFRTDFTYQYLIYPLLNERNRALMDPDSLQEVYDKYGKVFVESKYIKSVMINHNGIYNYYLKSIQNPDDDIYEGRICPLAVTYLKKMKSMCDEKGIKFIVRACPLMDTEDNHELQMFEQDIRKNGLEMILDGYMGSIKYYPEDWFKDGVHFTEQVLEDHMQEFQMEMLGVVTE